MPKTFLVSDETINSYRCRVLLAGGDTSAFESNPVMLYMHLRGNVIGKWTNLRREDGKLYADPVFDVDDEGLGKDIGGKVEREFINAASIGIVIDAAVYNDALECYDITKWSLQEISIVDIGSNQNALQLYDMSGEPLTELKLTAHLEQFKPVSTNSTNQPMALVLTAMALAMGLPETATEQEVMTLAADRKEQADAVTELAALKLTVQTAKTNEATTLVDEAIADKRIPATMKDTYLKLFASDHDTTKVVVAGLPKPQNLVTFASQGAAQIGSTGTDADAKTYDDMDKKGTLLNLSKQDPETFKRLYKAKFGKEPDKVNLA